jgi:acyl-CoA reductase-like NAD-dependent aldehyde dehydrogenase
VFFHRARHSEFCGGDKFIPILTKAAANFPISWVISTTGSENTLRLVKDAVAKGAQVVYGDVKLLEPAKLQPVVLKGLKPDMEIYDNESFGPVLAVFTVDSDEEAIELANSSRYGLSAGVSSKDIGRALQIASRIEVGQTHINFPFGTGTDEGE